jgi:alkylated DNA repair dioxygenase AlkB
MTNHYDGFVQYGLDERHAFFSGSLPATLKSDGTQFGVLWALHPDEYHEIMIHGRLVKTPRWQKAYGHDYHYTNRKNEALPVPPILEPFLSWSQAAVFKPLNGLLLNWYDGHLGHYIGAHHDSTKDMVIGAPIITISFGEERIFRLTQPKTKAVRDFPARDGTVFVMPYDTNKVWKHEVPKYARWDGRRISITIRAFDR